MISVRKKLLAIVAVIVIVPVILCQLLLNTYIQQVLIEQSIYNEKTKLSQVASGIDAFFMKVEDLGAMLAAQDSTQDLLKKYPNDMPINRMRGVQRILTDSEKHFFLFDWIGMAIVIGEDAYYRNNASIGCDHFYFREKIKEDWFRQNAKSSYFSKPFCIRDKNVRRVISYVQPVNSIVNGQGVEAYLLFLFYYEDIVKLVSSEVTESVDSFCWITNEGIVISESGKDNRALSSRYDKYRNYDEVSVESDENGYTTVTSCANGNWILMTYMSKDRFIDSVRRVTYMFLLLFTVAAFAMGCLMIPLVNRIISPVQRLTDVMNEVVLSRNLDAKCNVDTNDEFKILSDGFNHMMRELQEYIQSSLEHERIENNIRFALMLSQINPHFIFNCLNNVNMLIRIGKVDAACEMTDSLIRILIDDMKIGENHTVDSVRNEMQIVEKYVGIQKIRYRNICELVWDVDESLLDASIPKLIIQPIVENAILHSILPSGREGTVTVSIQARGDAICIRITDDGIGFSPEALRMVNFGQDIEREGRKRSSIGISNIRERIKFLFGDPYGISINSVESGAEVEIRIPLRGIVRRSV